MAGNLPSYITSAKPVPLSARAPWFKNTAPTYAGIFLWFAFWNEMGFRGLNIGGLASALVGIVIAAIVCHLLFYLAPGLLGLKTGLPLYVVGTSTFGTVGGLLLPGFLMGILQFGWLGVNTYYSSAALADANNSVAFYVLCVVWALAAAFVGLKGIQYVAKVATFLPLIPFAVLIFAVIKFGGSAGDFKVPGGGSADFQGGLFTVIGYIVGFFATAGAAGVDFGMNNRDSKDVNWGGMVGISLAIIFTAGASVLAIAGAQGAGVVMGADKAAFTTTEALKKTTSSGLFTAIMIGLTVASFPGACFSSFIAANSFRTVMPKINPFISVGLGALVSIILAMTGVAGDLPKVFGFIGASFGPIVGAMTVDYLLSNGKWAGPRAGWNVAGWGAWLLGFIVGILPNLGVAVPIAPVLAFVVGALVYLILAKLGLEGEKVPMEGSQPAAS